jgi:hypothetical protein
MNFEGTLKSNPLYFSFLFPALADSILTLLGQGPEYWDHQIVNEASPAYYFLLASPWLYILGALVWFVAWFFIFKKLKGSLSLWLSLFFLIAHSWGSSTWIRRLLVENGFYISGDRISITAGWAILILYFIVVALIASICLRAYFLKRS